MKLSMRKNLLRKLMKFTAENQVSEAWNLALVKNRWKGQIQEMEQTRTTLKTKTQIRWFRVERVL